MSEQALPGCIDVRFRQLVEQWRREIRPTSSTTQMVTHPAYREIIAMGQLAVPLLIEELRHRPDWWFAALREITGANPVCETHRGKLIEMAIDWIDWWEDRQA